jgi:hypothetical protein
MYGDSYLVYGAKTCRHCGEAHEDRLHIKETRRSRFKLMQFMALTRSRVDRAWTSFDGNSIQPTMLGLLIAQGLTIVAHSGRVTHEGDAAFRAAATEYGYASVMQNELDQPFVSLAGRRISDDELARTRGTRRGFDYPPGSCAAPRLIRKAFRLIANPNPATWEMSEIYCSAGGGGYWVHGLSAHSCDTCESLVPLLLCDQGLMGGLGVMNI